MDRSLPLFLVDVFAEAPLTVVADADEVGEDVMRAIAREFSQSETTCVLASTRDGVDRRLRSFTPPPTRFFNPTVGISEDPATGTAAGVLASNLVRRRGCRPAWSRPEAPRI